MKKNLISVVIPCYNSEKTISRCLDSILTQSFDDLEVICVEDCSTDKTLTMLQQYAVADERIRILPKNVNSGASHCRNIGIGVANGEYLSFIDSDDWVEQDFYRYLSLRASESNSDIVKGALVLDLPDASVRPPINTFIRINQLNFTSTYTTAIYKTDFLRSHNVLFPDELIIVQDVVFSLRAILLKPHLCIDDRAVYHYVKNNGSISDICANFDAKMASMIDAIVIFFHEINGCNIEYSDYLLLYFTVIVTSFWKILNKPDLSENELEKWFAVFSSVCAKHLKFKTQEILASYDCGIEMARTCFVSFRNKRRLSYLRLLRKTTE